MTRQQLRRARFQREFRIVNEEYGYLYKDGQVGYNMPRHARRRVARTRSKQ